MVKAWYIDEDPNLDDRTECHLNPPQFVDPQELKQKSGLILYKLDADNYENNPILEDIKNRHQCVHFDIKDLSPAKTPDELKRFNIEHLHAEEEVRFILDGGAYWNVRDKDDKWIRVKVEKGDLIILPPGMYHRLTLGFNESLRVMRLYTQPKWVAFDRGDGEEHPSRKIYMEQAANGFA